MHCVLQDKLAEGWCICALLAGQKEAVNLVGVCKPTGKGKQLQGMGVRLRFKFFKACEEQSC